MRRGEKGESRGVIRSKGQDEKGEEKWQDGGREGEAIWLGAWKRNCSGKSW